MISRFQVLPDLSPDEFDALLEDIRCRGVQLPIEVTTEDEVLDGHQRLRACAQLGIKDYPVKVVAGLKTDQAKRHHAIKANVLRRQLTREQRHNLIADELRRTKGRLSNRVLAGLFACSDHTIATVPQSWSEVRKFRTCPSPKVGTGSPTRPGGRPASLPPTLVKLGQPKSG